MDYSMNKMTATVALMSSFTLAICFIILGSISVELMSALDINEAKFGTLIMGMFLTSCFVQLFIGPLVDKIGFKPVAILGFSVVCISMFILAFSSSFAFALLSCILMGVGAMSVNTVGNTLIPIVLFEGKDPARASNFGNGFFGLGYILTPLLIVFIIKTLDLSYNVALMIVGGLSLVFLLFALFTNFPKVSTGFRYSIILKVLVKPTVLIASLALFCYISLEISMGTWIKPLMEEFFGGRVNIEASAKAGIVLSLFGVTMMAGRFITASVRNLTVIGSKVIIFSSALAIVTIIIMMLAKGPVLGVTAVLLIGLAFAPIFPTIVGITFAKFDPSLYGTIFGIMFAIGLLGGTFVPKIIGNLSVGSTIQGSLLVVLILAVILFVIAISIDQTSNYSDKKGN